MPKKATNKNLPENPEVSGHPEESQEEHNEEPVKINKKTGKPYLSDEEKN